MKTLIYMRTERRKIDEHSRHFSIAVYNLKRLIALLSKLKIISRSHAMGFQYMNRVDIVKRLTMKIYKKESSL